MRVAVLWTGLSGYFNACLKELASGDGIELIVIHRIPAVDAPFSMSEFAWISNRLTWNHPSQLRDLETRVKAFSPDILLFGGWHLPAYRRVARALSGKSLRVMAMDNRWAGSVRQHAAVLMASRFIRPLADVVWLPGERQAEFAARLGFTQSQIIRGLYSCDSLLFGPQHIKRLAEGRAVPRAFLFVGRLVLDKGVATLLDAYESYREMVIDPWPLVCCGTGPLLSRLEGQAGVRILGFIQPEQLACAMASCGCLVLPSNFEPWGVVVHEATSAGLIVIATDSVAAAVHLVQPNHNGFLCGRGDARHLADLMYRVAGMDDAALNEMSLASYSLSGQFSPSHWVDTLLQAKSSLS